MIWLFLVLGLFVVAHFLVIPMIFGLFDLAGDYYWRIRRLLALPR